MTASDSTISPLTLPGFLQSLRARWKVSAAIVAFSFLCGVIYLHVAPVRYSVAMQVVAVQGDSSSNLSAGQALLSQLGSAAASTQSNFELYLAGLQSIETATELAQRPDIMRRMFASEWNGSGWAEPPSWRRPIVRLAKQMLGLPVVPWQPPNPKRVEEFLAENVSISRSISSPVVTIVMSTSDPAFGVELLNALNRSVDGNLRRRTLGRVTGYIAYLSERIALATVLEYRESLAQTIVQQERVRMMAASGAPYAADVFARATASRSPVAPTPAILAVSLVVGVMLALFEALARDRGRFYRPFFRASAV